MADIKDLIAGYRRFYTKYFTSGNELYQQLATEGQSPKTLVIACCDSRVDPSIVMDAGPGDLFVVRNVANLVPPCEFDHTTYHGVSSALEFAVCMLNVENIIVMGHSKCAGIQALSCADTLKNTDFIGKWVSISMAAREKCCESGVKSEELQATLEKESIILSLGNLLTFPWIKEKVEANTLKLHGWYFCIEEGALSQYNPESNLFEAVHS